MSFRDNELRSTIERRLDVSGIMRLTREIWCCLRGRPTLKENKLRCDSTAVIVDLPERKTAAPLDASCSFVPVAGATSFSSLHSPETTTIRQVICVLPSPKLPFSDVTTTTVQPGAASSASFDSNQRTGSQFRTPVRSVGGHQRTGSGQVVTPVSGSCTSSPVTGYGTPIRTPPLRLKAKGLLERRGSNASLTLDLASLTSESPIVGSPPRESTAEEYLQLASNCLSRKDLNRSLNDPLEIHKEFWEIPMNHPDKIEVPGSGVKNRYRTILPNERTRVKLSLTDDDDPLSSYINANYIRGYRGEPGAYIATQGPMTNTVIDFWNMIWQERAPIIVMITKLQEQNRIKCESYLPDSSGFFGEIEVVTKEIVQYDGHILRNLVMKRGTDVHTIDHYWYTVWPDHKAPDAARNLLDLVEEVNERRRDPVTAAPKGPVVVHCSAGIGRTGCFIATSIGIEQLKNERVVDILSIVCGLRLDRGGMVQTNEQYEFVHRALSLLEKNLHDDDDDKQTSNFRPVSTRDDDQ